MDEFRNYSASLWIIEKIESLGVNALLPKPFETACYHRRRRRSGVSSRMRRGSNETRSPTSHNVSSFLFTGLRNEFNARLALTDALDRGKGSRGKGRGGGGHGKKTVNSYKSESYSTRHLRSRCLENSGGFSFFQLSVCDASERKKGKKK